MSGTVTQEGDSSSASEGALTPGAPDDSSVARWTMLHAPPTHTNIPMHVHSVTNANCTHIYN